MHECQKVNSGGYSLFIAQSEHAYLKSAIYLFGKY